MKIKDEGWRSIGWWFILGVLALTWVLWPAFRSQRVALAQEDQEKPAVKKLNPYRGNPEAIAEGQKLFIQAGCHACHGSRAGGGIGPNLTDDVWRYGGSDEMVFKTITQGRGQQMPRWGEVLEKEQIWKIIAFIRSLYNGDPDKIEW